MLQRTEIGDDDEDVAMVESYAFAERVRDELFGRAEEAPQAPAEAEAFREPEPPVPARPEEEESWKEDRLRAHTSRRTPTARSAL